MAKRRPRGAAASARSGSSLPRRPWPALVLMLALALAALAALAILALRRPHPRRPSLLLVTIDTLRADHVGAYGDAAAETPVLDGLGR